MQRLLLHSIAIADLALSLPSLPASGDEIAITLSQDGPVEPGGSIDFHAEITNITSSTLFFTGGTATGAFPLTVDDTNFCKLPFLQLPRVTGPGQQSEQHRCLDS